MKNSNLIEAMNSLILKQAEFLSSRQVYVKPLRLSPGQTVDLVPFLNTKLTIVVNQNDGVWSISSGDLLKDIELGKPFRLPLTHPVDKTSPSVRPKAKGIEAKLRRYSKYPDLHIRVPVFLFSKFNQKLRKQRQISIGKHSYRDQSLKFESGLTFVAIESKDSLVLECLDDGGIFDMNLNTEGDTYPAQVPVSYYSTEYAAFVFFWLWQRTKDEKWREAAKNAVDFSLRNLRPYTNVSFDHFEFKILPLLLVAREFDISELIDQETDEYLNHVSYAEHNYAPINVYCMRVANLALSDHLSHSNEGEKKAEQYLSIVARNLTAQGQIQDNFKPASLYNFDLTYHQFSIACLSIALTSFPNGWDDALRETMVKMVEAGVDFSMAMTRPDGHPSYMGRGCNNIYHLASYLFALVAAEKNYLIDLSKIIKLLGQFNDQQLGLPSALNHEREKRMGWNHCAVPYIGQTLFFLALAIDKLELRRGKTGHAVGPSERPALTDCNPFSILQSEKFHLVVFSGGDTYSWCSGSHVVGIGGVASLSYEEVPLTAALEFSDIDQRWSSDLPNECNAPPEGVFKNKIIKTENEIDVLGKHFFAKYSLNSNALKIEYDVSQRKEWNEFQFLTLRDDTVRIENLGDQRLILETISGARLIVTLNTYASSTISLKPKLSNSFGPCRSIVVLQNGSEPIERLIWRLESLK